MVLFNGTDGLQGSSEFSVIASVMEQTERRVAVNRSAHATAMEEREVGVKEDRRDANAIQKRGGSAALNNRRQREGVSMCK